MATVYIDDKPYEVDPSQNLLQVCLSLGINLPYFCWHPTMGSVGACRQCAVKQFRNEKDQKGRIYVACMIPAKEGTRISVMDPEAKAFRTSVIEWLMVNHPHDCPVCDEGGHCHLQDMTYMTGHVYRRYRFQKKTYKNQYLGPFINHEMNRCIQCYRCVRFYRDYAGGRDLNVFGSRDRVYFGRYEEGVLENEFSGNLVEVCPTGVFTDKTWRRHYTRKWDLQTARSVCVHCSLGCNILPGERYGKLRTIQNFYNDQVNGYFLCDRGRFGYEFVNSEKRIRSPLLRSLEENAAEPASREAALGRLSQILFHKGKLIGIGSPRASLEGNFALRTLVGPERFYVGIPARDHRLLSLLLRILQEGPARACSLKAVEQADAVLVLGEDVTNVAPRLALSLRQSARQEPMRRAAALDIPPWDDAATREVIQGQKGPLFLATPFPTRLDDAALETYRATPADLARLGFAVAHHIDPESPAVPELPDEVQDLAARIAEALQGAQRPLVITGISLRDDSLLQAAANITRALHQHGREPGIFFIVPEANHIGLALLGGESLDAARAALESGEADTLVILENDLYQRMDPEAARSLLSAARHVVVLDFLQSATTQAAEVVLPVSTFAEGSGSLVSAEGRAQRFYRVFVPETPIQESWRWIRDAMLAAGRAEVEEWQALDDLWPALVKEFPVFQRFWEETPPASFRLAGQKKPREPHRYSGRTAMFADRTMHEPPPPPDPDTPLRHSMEGSSLQPPPGLIPFFWAPGWNSIQSLHKFQEEVDGPLRGGTPGVRILEPAQEQPLQYFSVVPHGFTRREAQWLILPVYHIFGSEELSGISPGIAERTPSPYLLLNPDDTERLQVDGKGKVRLRFHGVEYQLSIFVEESLPTGTAGLFAGLSALRGIELPSWGILSRVMAL